MVENIFNCLYTKHVLPFPVILPETTQYVNYLQSIYSVLL